jgi:hemerythrin-like domain-containing protein
MIRPQSLFGPSENPSTLDSPLDHLMACHRRIEERLATMERAAAHLDDRREEALTAFENAFRFMESSGALHTADEEESLFPRLAELVQPGERGYLEGLEHDHAEAERIYAELKEAVAAARSGGVSRVTVEELAGKLAALYRRHIESEDRVLQAYAKEHLTPEHLAAIAAEMKKRRAG